MNPFPSGFKLFLIPPSKNLRLRWRLVSPSGRAVRLTDQQGALMSQLMGRYGLPVHRAKLMDALWGDDPEGGPLDPASVIKVQLHRLRRICRAVGMDFECRGNWAHSDKDNAYTLKNMRECVPFGTLPAYYRDHEYEVEVKTKLTNLLKREEAEIFFSYRAVPSCKVREVA